MSIYVKVGAEVICVAGPGGDAGKFASSEPIPVEVLEREIANSRLRQGHGSVRGAGSPSPSAPHGLQGPVPGPHEGWDMAVVDGVPRAEKSRVGSVEDLATGFVTLTQVAGRFVERKPPGHVDAVLWTGTNWPEVSEWLRPRVDSAKLSPEDASTVVVWDDDGRMICRDGTWLVQGGSGEVTNMSADKFEGLYAPARRALDRLEWARVVGNPSAPAWVQVIDKQVIARLEVDDVAMELNALVAAAGPPFDDSDVQLDAWARWAADTLKEDLAPLREDAARRRHRLDRDAVLRKRVRAVLEAPSVIPADLVSSAPPASRELAGDLVVEACARVGHEVYRAGRGGSDMSAWEHSPDHDRATARDSARAALDGVPPEAWFARWRAGMIADGWTLGGAADGGPDQERRVHPNLVASYEDLPEGQRILDRTFAAAVVATAAAIGDIEEACSVPVLKVRGDVSTEQFEEFKREWKRQVMAAPAAWKPPILDAPEVVAPRLRSPYTRSGTISFVDELVDSMLRAPVIWGSLEEVELQVLLLMEVRGFVTSGQAGADAVMDEYARFVAFVVGDSGSADPLSRQARARRGRAGEFIAAMEEFVAGRRAAQPVLADMKDHVRDLAASRGGDHARLVELFEQHCECRPTNTARTSHSHDCGTDVTDDVRTVIHRLVMTVPPAGSLWGHDEQRPATDDEVRDARAHLVALAIWEGAARDLKDGVR